MFECLRFRVIVGSLSRLFGNSGYPVHRQPRASVQIFSRTCGLVVFHQRTTSPLSRISDKWLPRIIDHAECHHRTVSRGSHHSGNGAQRQGPHTGPICRHWFDFAATLVWTRRFELGLARRSDLSCPSLCDKLLWTRTRRSR